MYDIFLERFECYWKPITEEKTEYSCSPTQNLYTEASIWFKIGSRPSDTSIDTTKRIIYWINVRKIISYTIECHFFPFQNDLSRNDAVPSKKSENNSADQHQTGIVQSVECTNPNRQMIEDPPAPVTTSETTDTLDVDVTSATTQKDVENGNNEINEAVIESCSVITHQLNWYFVFLTFHYKCHKFLCSIE